MSASNNVAWATEIVLQPSAGNSSHWRARCEFRVSQPGTDQQRRGTIETEDWAQSMAAAIDEILVLAAVLGIQWLTAFDLVPTLRVFGYDADESLPAAWAALLDEQAARLGWRTPSMPHFRQPGQLFAPSISLRIRAYTDAPNHYGEVVADEWTNSGWKPLLVAIGMEAAATVWIAAQELADDQRRLVIVYLGASFSPSNVAGVLAPARKHAV